MSTPVLLPPGAPRVPVPGVPAPDAPADDAPADDVLAAWAADGDGEAFTALVDRHGPGLHRHAALLLTDAGLVEDCLQESLVAAWRGLPARRDPRGVVTWLFAIVHREAVARTRLTAGPASRGRVPAGVDPAAVADRILALRDDPARTGVESGLRQALALALTLLPEPERSTWVLREVERLDVADIATVLGLAPDAVQDLLARARTLLARALRDWR